MAKRGRPKKDHARFPCGDLRPFIDRGHELTLLHRAAATGGANPNDYRAGFPAGILYLRGEIDQAEYQALLAYGFIRAIAGPRAGGISDAVWGNSWQHLMPKTPQSHLANMLAEACPPLADIADDERESRIRRCAKQAREANGYILIDGKLPLAVLEAVAVYETVGPEAYLSRREHQALKAAAERLVRLWKIPRPEPAADGLLPKLS